MKYKKNWTDGLSKTIHLKNILKVLDNTLFVRPMFDQKIRKEKSRLKSGFKLYQERESNPHGLTATRF